MKKSKQASKATSKGKTKSKSAPRVKFKLKATKGIARKSAAKGKAKTGYNPQTGALTGREVSAQVRLDKLTERYEAEGLSRPEARARAVPKCASTTRAIGVKARACTDNSGSVIARY